MAFTQTQVKCLSGKLSAKHVRTRDVNGHTRAYLEGWYVIAEANRIFGHDGWDRMTLSADCVWSDMRHRFHTCAYAAKVRITVRAGDVVITREGCGSGEGKGETPGEAHDNALKAAETDATKRALTTFGNPFGLALYDRELKGVRNAARITEPAPDKTTTWSLISKTGTRVLETPDAFHKAFRQALDQAPDIEALFNLWEKNVEMVRVLRRTQAGPTSKEVVTASLAASFKARAIVLAKGNADTGQTGTSSDPCKGNPQKTISSRGIDKSMLRLSEPRRIRSRDHLRNVARRPCLICGRTPSHAHHLRFAQPSAMARKVSDEFVVPLCASHHDEVHRAGNEKSWWKSHGLNAIEIAEQLWARSKCGPGTNRETKPGLQDV